METAFIIIAFGILIIILYNKINRILILEREILTKNRQIFELQNSLEKNETITRTSDVKFPFGKNKTKKKLNTDFSNLNYNITSEDIIAYQDKKIERQYLYPKKDLVDRSHYFYGKKVVITGDYNSFSNRNEMAKLLWEVGADVDTGIGKYTEVLIVGDYPGNSKIVQAEDMGIEFITENEFLNYFSIKKE